MSRILTPVATLSYPHLFEPVSAEKGNPNSKKKYSAALVFGPDADLSKLEEAVLATAREKYGDKFYFDGQPPPAGTVEERKKFTKLRYPIRVDDEGKYGPPGEHRYINARSDSRPNVVDAQLRPIDDARADEIYPGAQVRASLSVFSYAHEANKGISFGLGNVQKVAEGERIDGRARAEDEFDAIAPAELEAAGVDLI